MIKLIREGFDENTLGKLKLKCSENFGKNPALYFLLFNIFDRILQSFERQGMPIDRYEEIISINPALEKAIEQKDMQSLDDLCRAVVKIFELGD